MKRPCGQPRALLSVLPHASLHFQFVIERPEPLPLSTLTNKEGRYSATRRIAMKRIVLVAVLVFGFGLGAQADNTVYHNTLKQPRGDDALHADGRYCDQRVGPDKNGTVTSAAYKKCMLSRGWRYQYTTRERTPREQTWIDPETGLTCHDILGGFGSSCSNF
jgi:hypothetical protein